jgi:hypothetical protein
MIEREHLKGFSEWDNRAEYTRYCGWIDWHHATPGREDLQEIWSHLPHDTLSPAERRDTSEQWPLDLEAVTLRDTATRVGSAYYEVPFSLETDRWTTVWDGKLFSSDFRFYVKKGARGQALYYERAALALYQYGCEKAESYQADSRVTDDSGWSMEDLVSNLIAFYMHVEGLTREVIVREAGGWTNREAAERNSWMVFNRMKDTQPRTDPTHWYEAYLFNHLVDCFWNGETDLWADPDTGCQQSDRREGWHPVPDFFQRIQPLTWSRNAVPGDDILIDGWQARQALRARNGLPGAQTRFLAQQQVRFPGTGLPRGVGRGFGPLGTA